MHVITNRAIARFSGVHQITGIICEMYRIFNLTSSVVRCFWNIMQSIAVRSSFWLQMMNPERDDRQTTFFDDDVMEWKHSALNWPYTVTTGFPLQGAGVAELWCVL